VTRNRFGSGVQIEWLVEEARAPTRVAASSRTEPLHRHDHDRCHTGQPRFVLRTGSTVHVAAHGVLPVSAAELNSSLPSPGSRDPARRCLGDSDWVVADRTENPCECDLAKGISTACIFKD
jgi:hypothetical protein